jgi:hypothetical protein
MIATGAMANMCSDAVKQLPPVDPYRAPIIALLESEIARLASRDGEV